MASKNTIRFAIKVDGKEAVYELDKTQQGIRELSGEVARGKREARDLNDRFAGLGLALDGIQQSAELARQTFGRALQVYRDTESAQRRLAATSELTGVSLSKMQDETQQAAERFKLSERQASAFTIRLTKLTQRAGEVEKTNAAMSALMDTAAAKGLEANEALTAVRQAILGVDEGTDKLFGRNPSSLYEEYAASIGTTAGKLDDQQKAQAVLNELMETGAKVQGEYADFLETSAGRQQVFNSQLERAQAQFGSLVADAMGPMLEASTEVLGFFNSLPPSLQRLIGMTGSLLAVIQALRISGLVPTSASLSAFGARLSAIPAQAAAAGGGLAALRAGLRATTAAAKGFFASLGPLGWISLALGTVVEAWALLGTETQEAADATADWRSEMEALPLSQAQGRLKDLQLDLAATRALMDSLTGSVQAYGREIELGSDPPQWLQDQIDRLEAQEKFLEGRIQQLQEERKRREQERRSEEQEEQLQELRLKAMDEGIARQRAKLEQWYDEQKKLAEGSKENLALVEQVYNKRLAQLQEKRQEAAREREMTLREIEIEAMEEGFEKRLAQTDLQIDREIEKYRQKYAEEFPGLFENIRQELEKQRRKLKQDLLPETPEIPLYKPVLPDLPESEIDWDIELKLEPPKGFGEAWNEAMSGEVEPALQRTRDAIRATENEIRKLQDAGQETGHLQGVLQDLRRAEAALMAFKKASDVAVDAIAGSFAALGESLGESIAGVADQTQSIGDRLLGVLAQAARTLGQYLLKIGAPLFLVPGMQGTALAYSAAGTALLAIGSAISASISDAVGEGGQDRPEHAEPPAFAGGVTNYEGGVALVGEEGPELVSLPRGSNVLTNENTRALLSTIGATAPRIVRRGVVGGGGSKAIIDRLDKLEDAFVGKQFRLRGTEMETQQVRQQALYNDAGIK